MPAGKANLVSAKCVRAGDYGSFRVGRMETLWRHGLRAARFSKEFVLLSIWNLRIDRLKTNHPWMREFSRI